MSFVLNTLHIFGYGEAQVIGKDGDVSVNKKVSTSALTKVAAVVDSVYSSKPSGNAATKDYHAINVFSKSFADFQPKDKSGNWRVKWADIDEAAVNALVAEILSM